MVEPNGRLNKPFTLSSGVVIKITVLIPHESGVTSIEKSMPSGQSAGSVKDLVKHRR